MGIKIDYNILKFLEYIQYKKIISSSSYFAICLFLEMSNSVNPFDIPSL